METTSNYRFTESFYMPRQMHYGNNFYEFISAKTQKHIQCYSTLEYYNAICLEMDHNVEYYLPQIGSFEVRDDNGELFHIAPDVYVYYRDDVEEIQEVKYYRETVDTDDQSLRSQRQIKLERQWAYSNGMKFDVRTEKKIIKNRFQMANLIWMYGHVSQYSNVKYADYCNHIKDILSDGGKVSIRDIALMLKVNEYTAMTTVSQMYSQGLISMNIEERQINLDTGVTL